MRRCKFMLLCVMIMSVTGACHRELSYRPDRHVEVYLSLPSSPGTKGSPVGAAIFDVNYYAYDINGRLIIHEYKPDHHLDYFSLRMRITTPFYLYVIVNAHKDIVYYTMPEIEEATYSVRSPKNISNSSTGWLMSGKTPLVSNSISGPLTITVTPVFATMYLKVDKSRFTGEEYTVTQLCVRNCPTATSLFAPFSASSISDVDINGYISDEDLSDINLRYVPLFSTENMMGNLLAHNTDPAQKVLSGYGAEDYTTFVEVEVYYRSRTLYGTMRYRFYPGKNNTSNFDIERGCQYFITISPVGEGMNVSNWRIDASWMKYYVQSINLPTRDIVELYSCPSPYYLHYNIFPASAANKTLSWSSTNTNVATVASDGGISVYMKGNTQIIATTTDGSNISDTTYLVVFPEKIIIKDL